MNRCFDSEVSRTSVLNRWSFRTPRRWRRWLPSATSGRCRSGRHAVARLVARCRPRLAPARPGSVASRAPALRRRRRRRRRRARRLGGRARRRGARALRSAGGARSDSTSAARSRRSRACARGCARRHGRGCVILPSNPRLKRWDGALGALVFTAVVTPVEIAFCGEVATTSLLYGVNRAVARSSSRTWTCRRPRVPRRAHRRIVQDSRAILRHYARSWFAMTCARSAVRAAGGVGRGERSSACSACSSSRACSRRERERRSRARPTLSLSPPPPPRALSARERSLSDGARLIRVLRLPRRAACSRATRRG